MTTSGKRSLVRDGGGDPWLAGGVALLSLAAAGWLFLGYFKDSE
jgi:hypothetical protein